MKHYGDIKDLHGDVLEPVDLIVGGSPCQDFSVAGQKKGLSGKRSSLFLEMVRIVKEMRKATDGLYPRFILWENVVGIYNVNDGRDFSAVLTELSRVAEPDTPDVPMPQEGWAKSGILLGFDWAVSWRTHNAQFWGKTIRDSRTGDVLQMGTPQRRRRIALIADFRGQTAYEILFEPKGMSRDFEPSGAQREGIAKEVDGSFEGSGKGGDEAYGLDRASFNQGKNALFDFAVDREISSSLVAKGPPAVYKTVVRRLTPLEEERLQGFPDGWTNIPEATDAKRYKALGNSLCLPFWEWLADRFVKTGGVKTIGSLFDGIAGFPLCFKKAGAETRWVSEIDPFPNAVCKFHFGDEDAGIKGDIEKYLKKVQLNLF